VALLCEGSATAALQFDEGLREELEGLKVTALTRRAIEAGVDVDAMADPPLFTLLSSSFFVLTSRQGVAVKQAKPLQVLLQHSSLLYCQCQKVMTDFQDSASHC
jgi:hypothetical protein